jgi:SAM-dependent methyltransferase
MDPSMERLVPDQLDLEDPFDKLSYELHLERYLFASRLLPAGKILDMACGAGYGIYGLASLEKFQQSLFTGVDISAKTIDYAKRRYAHPSIQYIRSDVLDYTDEQPYDGIISLETIEHLKDPTAFVQKLYDLLRPGGILIVSAPVTLSTDGNPFHLSDFSERSFRKLFPRELFTEMEKLLQVQPYTLSGVMGSGKNKRISGIGNHLLQFYLTHPHLFFMRLVSLLKNGFANKYRTLALERNI